ncbi:MAG: hypothetical protein RLZZ419_2142 [Pseudomonadota bacterium]|jgi:hypothetical protein
MEIIGEFLGKDQDKGIWEYFRDHWHSWFPHFVSRANFAKHCANLWAIKKSIQEYLSKKLNGYSDSIHLADGFPMPVCRITRAQSQCFKGEAGYGYCAAKDEIYYGFEGHIAINFTGVIRGDTFASANIDERDVLQDITQNLSGLLIGDKGFIRPFLKEELANQGLELQTPLRKNMTETRPASFLRQLLSTRRLVETVIGQLTQRFNIEKIRARDLWHLTNRFVRKLLSYTMAIFLNRCLD